MAIIGVDLGNNFARVAVLRDGSVEHIIDKNGDAKIPCYVAFTDEDTRLIGKAAKDQVLTNPRNTIFNAKRLLGQKVVDVGRTNTFYNLPYLIDKSENNHLMIKLIHNKEVLMLTPEEALGSILHRTKIVAEKHLNTPVAGAVVSVPASFNGIQRQAILDAGKIAGLNVLRLINEPTAAMIGVGQHNGIVGGIKLLFHLGGGSFDVSVLKVTAKTYQVIATSGEPQLGGIDFTERLMSRLMCSILNVNFENSASDLENLRMECERVKILLASNESEVLKFKSVTGDSETTPEVTVAYFEEQCKELLSKIQSHLELVLQDAQLNPIDIDEVYLTGDSTKLPFIKNLLHKMFIGKKLVQLEDVAVARGCALEAGILEGDVDLIIQDISAHSLDLYLEPSWVYMEIVPKCSQVPYQYKAVMSRIFTTGCSQLRFTLYENFNGYKTLMGEYEVRFLNRAELISAFKLIITVDANGICRCIASTTLPDGEVIQLEVSNNKCMNNLSDTAIERAANEMVLRHSFEENVRRRRIARKEFVHVFQFWSEPFRKTRHEDKFAAKFYEKLLADQKWLTTGNEKDADVWERRLEELKSYCTSALEEAIANIPLWVKNSYNIKIK